MQLKTNWRSSAIEDDLVEKKNFFCVDKNLEGRDYIVAYSKSEDVLTLSYLSYIRPKIFCPVSGVCQARDSIGFFPALQKKES